MFHIFICHPFIHSKIFIEYCTVLGFEVKQVRVPTLEELVFLVGKQ